MEAVLHWHSFQRSWDERWLDKNSNGVLRQLLLRLLFLLQRHMCSNQTMLEVRVLLLLSVLWAVPTELLRSNQDMDL